MSDDSEAYVAFDTSKLRNAVALAEAGRAGEVRFLGEIENTEAATAKLSGKPQTEHISSAVPPIAADFLQRTSRPDRATSCHMRRSKNGLTR
jgi:hypothetical protein